jgi:BirA family biotin operon repressor/biotin-[acetyl-CoA-carboxylase] ligase
MFSCLRAGRETGGGGGYGDPVEKPSRAQLIVGSRRPLAVPAITAAVRERVGWSIQVVAETGSTNDDLAAVATAGGAGARVLIAELQQTGKGRRGRVWTAPPGAGLTMSVLIDASGIPPARRSWIGVIGGLSLVRAVTAVTGLPAALKWPNDLLVDGRKCAGLLAEAAGDQLILGMGLNVSLDAGDLPRPDATSLLLAGAATLDRAVLAAAILDELARWLDRWRNAAGDPERSGLRSAFVGVCATLGQRVRVELPSGEHVVGEAVDIAADGSLVVRTATGERAFSAADVHHLRPAD